MFICHKDFLINFLIDFGHSYSIISLTALSVLLKFSPHVILWFDVYKYENIETFVNQEMKATLSFLSPNTNGVQTPSLNFSSKCNL